MENISDQELLQEDLDRLAGWCAANKLQLNIDKCCFISFFRKAIRFQTIYSIDVRALKYVLSVKDLYWIRNYHLSSTSIPSQ